MADLRVEAKSFVTSLPLFPLSKDFTSICKMSAVWVGDSSSGNLLPFTAHVDQHCVLYLNLGGLLCGYRNTIRYCFHTANIRLVIDTYRFVTIWTFFVIISWCTYALLRALFNYDTWYIHWHYMIVSMINAICTEIVSIGLHMVWIIFILLAVFWLFIFRWNNKLTVSLLRLIHDDDQQ
jgi:hypothetical protein